MLNQVLLHSQTAGYQVSLVTNLQKLVAHAGKPENIDCAAVSLQIITAPGHRLTRGRVLVGHGHAGQPAIERFFLAVNEARAKPFLLILITTRKFPDGQTGF